MRILSIDTSCDETAAAITERRRVLSQSIFSQIVTHKQWGGVVPSLAKRVHEERIDGIIAQTLRKYATYVGVEQAEVWNTIDAVAVTYGPGLAIALEVGIRKAKELAAAHGKPLVAVNHMEGHIYSSFVQNRNGNPKREYTFPYLALLISGAHTEIVLFSDHLTYKVLGETRDDAAGEAIDKAARMLGFGYPGGPVLERLSEQAGNSDIYKFPRPMVRSKDLNFSFSGLKTSFLYFTRAMTEKEKTDSIRGLASSFQAAIFDTLVRKTASAMDMTGVNNLVVGGGVAANLHLRNLLKHMVTKRGGTVIFPSYKYLTGDNAAMIGVVAYYKAQKGLFVQDFSQLDRVPRLSLSEHFSKT